MHNGNVPVSVFLAAHSAPSPHNTQPWRFRPQTERIRVGWDPRRELPAGDPDHRYLLTSLGAAVEGMVLDAGQVGLVARVSFNLRTASCEAATVRLTPDAVSTRDLSLAAALPYRQTTRLPFYRDPVPSDALALLEREGRAHDCDLTVLTSRTAIRQVAQTLVEGTIRNFEASAVYEEFFRWVRLDPHDPRYRRDGLARESLTPGGFSSLLAPWVLPTARMHALQRVRMHRLVAATQGRLARHSPAICLLAARSHASDDVFGGGRAMMRVWLAATRLGLRVHPITAMMDHDETRGALADLFGVPRQASMVVCFRLGFGPRAPRSSRLPLGEVLAEGFEDQPAAHRDARPASGRSSS
jgi:hypothetical protein